MGSVLLAIRKFALSIYVCLRVSPAKPSCFSTGLKFPTVRQVPSSLAGPGLKLVV